MGGKLICRAVANNGRIVFPLSTELSEIEKELLTGEIVQWLLEGQLLEKMIELKCRNGCLD